MIFKELVMLLKIVLTMVYTSEVLLWFFKTHSKHPALAHIPVAEYRFISLPFYISRSVA